MPDGSKAVHIVSPPEPSIEMHFFGEFICTNLVQIRRAVSFGALHHKEGAFCAATPGANGTCGEGSAGPSCSRSRTNAPRQK